MTDRERRALDPRTRREIEDAEYEAEQSRRTAEQRARDADRERRAAGALRAEIENEREEYSAAIDDLQEVLLAKTARIEQLVMLLNTATARFQDAESNLHILATEVEQLLRLCDGRHGAPLDLREIDARIDALDARVSRILVPPTPPATPLRDESVPVEGGDL